MQHTIVVVVMAVISVLKKCAVLIWAGVNVIVVSWVGLVLWRNRRGGHSNRFGGGSFFGGLELSVVLVGVIGVVGSSFSDWLVVVVVGSSSGGIGVGGGGNGGPKGMGILNSYLGSGGSAIL